MSQNNDSWGLTAIWNKSLTESKRKLEKRNYIYASELGWSFYDRFYKMKGRKPTTPPNKRSLRKFEAGNLTEWTVKQILKRAGIFHETQTRVMFEGELEVSGKLDFLAGGFLKSAEFDDLPDVFQRVAESAYQTLYERFPNGLRQQIIEVKSCSSMMFERYLKAPAENHVLQTFHYAYNLNLPAVLIYISKDDLRLTEWVILPENEKLKKKYLKDIKEMARILKMKKPPKEELIVFNPRKKTFSKNPKVEYSNYLTDYGFKRPDEYAEQAGRICRRLNNVMKTIKSGKELSKNNLEAIKIAIEFDSNLEELINRLIKKD